VPGLDHHFLHASELSFTHPHGGQAIQLQAPLPNALRAVLESLTAAATGS
jgi:hypothetical protein